MATDNFNKKMGGGGGSWGTITGTLSNQIDLQDALDLKGSASDVSTLQSDIVLKANISDVFMYKHKVLTKINNLYSKDADVILTTTGVTDLQTAINSLTTGQILEVQTNATYNPIIVPTTQKIIIRAGIGWMPIISGSRCIALSNNAQDVIISGFILPSSNNVGGNNNYQGCCITLNSHQAKVFDIIFHNITMTSIATGSAVMLSYHWSVSGDNYANPPQLSELSENIAFVNCNIYKGCLDGTEGACIAVRGIKNFYAFNNFIDNGNDAGRGIACQGCLVSLIENNKIYNIGGANAEAIKIDEIGTSPFTQTAIIVSNYTDKNIEGIDIDDKVSAIVISNKCKASSDDAITLDDSSRGFFADNLVFESGNGFLFEAGSSGYLINNNSFSNKINYNMANGYVPNASNVSMLKRCEFTITKNLSEGISANLFELFVANNTSAICKIKYGIEAINSGTNTVEMHYGEFMVIARNQGGTITSTSSHPSSMEVDLPIGTGITDTFVVTDGTGKVTISVTAISGITPTSLKIRYDYLLYSDNGIVLL